MLILLSECVEDPLQRACDICPSLYLRTQALSSLVMRIDAGPSFGNNTTETPASPLAGGGASIRVLTEERPSSGRPRSQVQRCVIAPSGGLEPVGRAEPCREPVSLASAPPASHGRTGAGHGLNASAAVTVPYSAGAAAANAPQGASQAPSTAALRAVPAAPHAHVHARGEARNGTASPRIALDYSAPSSGRSLQPADGGGGIEGGEEWDAMAGGEFGDTEDGVDDDLDI